MKRLLLGVFFVLLVAGCGAYPVATTGYGTQSQSEYGKVQAKPLTSHTPTGSWIKGKTVFVQQDKYRRNNDIVVDIVGMELQRFGAEVNILQTSQPSDLIATVKVAEKSEIVVVVVTIAERGGKALGYGVGEATYTIRESKVYSRNELKHLALKSAAVYAVRAAISK